MGLGDVFDKLGALGRVESEFRRDYRIILSLLALLVPPFNNIYGHLININLQNNKERNK